jgi:hypothetical protein
MWCGWNGIIQFSPLDSLEILNCEEKLKLSIYRNFARPFKWLWIWKGSLAALAAKGRRVDGEGS